jgi:hypothetical protein
MPAKRRPLIQETEQLRLELLDCIIKTTQTFLDLTEMEAMEGNRSHYNEGINHIREALSRIKKILADVPPQVGQARFSDRLNQIEQRTERLHQDNGGDR